MSIVQKVKDIGIKFTYYVGGRAYDNSKTKRTTAFEDIMGKRKENNDKGQLESSTGVGKEDNLNVE